LGGDPLGLGGAGVEPSRQAASAQRDDAPPLSGAFRPPQARRDQPEARRDAPIIPADEPLHEAAPGMVFSWDAPPSMEAQDEIRSVIVPAPVETDALREARKDRRPAPAPARVAAAERAQEPAAAAAPARAPVPRDELLEALLRGAGTAQLRIPDGLTPELMQLIGGLLRESIAGTLQLLLARALTKREVRAEATLIVATENNPLKFSPTVEAALVHLLASNGPGFMPPVAAVRDAYNDLRSHQFGIMAGMRAALASVLARFNPHELEKRLTDKRGLSALLPSSRKAKLWELYEQLYSDISREAEDDFQALFGREFLKAYEAQIQKLEQQDG
jgi:FHA domain-containing protein